MDNTQTILYTSQASAPGQTPVAPTSATPTGLEITPILVALVTGVIGISTGVATGWITAVYAPKANWRVELEKLNYSRKTKIINGLRETLNDKSKTILSVFDHDDFRHIEREFNAKDIADIKELRAEITDFINSYYKEKCGIDLENNFDHSDVLEFVKNVQDIEKHDLEIVNALRYLSIHADIVNLILRMLCDLEVKWGLVNPQ